MILNTENIILIYQYFKVESIDNEYQQKRQDEIDLCLIINNNNKYIDEIHLLVEELYDLSFISNTTKIKQIVINKRLSYQDAFRYYNINLSNQICILSNADIYYDDSLNILKYVNFNFKTVLCLTRYEDNIDNELKLLCGTEYDYTINKNTKGMKKFGPSIWTQDCWIWKDYQININNCDFHLGIPGCDNHIVYLFNNNNYNIYNPSKLISSNHIDRLRNKITTEGIQKGNYINANNRIRNINEYYYLKNISDITDVYTNMAQTSVNYVDLHKIILSTNINKSISKIDNFDIYTSSDNDIHNSSFILFKNKDNYWNPLNFDIYPYILISFNQVKNIVILDIRGKTVDRNDCINGCIESFNVKYTNKDNQIIELDKNFTCINQTNGNFINRFYLDKAIECKSLVIYNMKFIGIRTTKIRLWEKNDEKINNTYVNNQKLVYYNNYKSWQKPVITEYQIFKNLINNNIIPYNYFAFPWANLIDSKYVTKYKYLNDTLSNYKNNDLSIKFFTIIQSIHFRDYLQICKNLNIKYVFTPHKLISDIQLEEKNDIKIIPLSLFPVQYRKLNEVLIDISKRKIFASFIGCYNQKIYISDIRLKIYNIFCQYNDCLIKETKEWHYQSHVFKDKINNNLDKNELEYKLSLSQSIFSLCPSGSGPNSIRIWESMSYGTIPVILADNLVLPKIQEINYDDCFIIWKESEIENLYEYLKRIDIQKVENMSKKCIDLFNKYFSLDKMHLQVLEYLSN